MYQITLQLSREISDLSYTTGLEISTTKSFLSSTIETEISTLSSESVKDINDLSNIHIQNIS